MLNRASITAELAEDLKRIAPRRTPDFSIKHAAWMVRELAEHADWPEDKWHRWLGFVQGALVATGRSSIARERDRVTRHSHE